MMCLASVCMLVRHHIMKTDLNAHYILDDIHLRLKELGWLQDPYSTHCQWAKYLGLVLGTMMAAGVGLLVMTGFMSVTTFFFPRIIACNRCANCIVVCSSRFFNQYKCCN